MTATVKGTKVFVQMHGEVTDGTEAKFIVVGTAETLGDGSRLYVYDSSWDGFRKVVYRCDYTEAQDRTGYRHEVLSAGLRPRLAVFGHCGLDQPLACFYDDQPVAIIPEGQYEIVQLEDGALVRHPL